MNFHKSKLPLTLVTNGASVTILLNLYMEGCPKPPSSKGHRNEMGGEGDSNKY